MEAHDLDRLKYEQEKAIFDTKERITHLQNFQGDYDNLEKRLASLPDKTTHDIMVPFGKFAFMPGKLVHTNEITVLLGDNWFAERSAKQTIEIIERRKKAVQSQIDGLQKQLDLLTPRLDFTKGLKTDLTINEDVFEIKEDYDEEKEKIWREKHKVNLKKAREKERKSKITTAAGDVTENKSLTTNDDKIWERLAVLEKQERVHGEMRKLGQESVRDTAAEEQFLASFITNRQQSPDSREEKKKVKWKDEENNLRVTSALLEEAHGEDLCESSTDSDDDCDDDDQWAGPARATVIRFSHTKQTEPTSQTEVSAAGDGVPQIVSPADIYNEFIDGRPCKSILKPDRKQAFPIKEPLEEPPSERVIVPGSEQAFSGYVRERPAEKPPTEGPPIVQPNVNTLQKEKSDGPNGKTEVNQPPKRVSKFKAQRMQQQRN